MQQQWQTLSQEKIFEELGKNLKELRLSFNYSQTELANKTDLSRSTIQRIERGEALNFDSVIRIFRVYGRLNDLQRVFEHTRNVDPIALLKSMKNDNK